MAWLTVANEVIYLRTDCDYRDRLVSAWVGRLVDGRIPDGWLAGPRRAVNVGEIAWLATGRRRASFRLGSYPEESQEAIDAAVARLADALTRYGSEILSDVGECERVFELMMVRCETHRTTTTRLGEAFFSSVRKRFGELFRIHGFVERETFRGSDFAWVMSVSESLFLRTHWDFEDRVVRASLGRLTGGSLPPDWWMDPTTVADVRKIPITVIAWLATGDREASFALGSYSDDSGQALDAAVGQLADALSRHGARLLAGDATAWDRAAELLLA